jgi:hypothetical protein
MEMYAAMPSIHFIRRYVAFLFDLLCPGKYVSLVPATSKPTFFFHSCTVHILMLSNLLLVQPIRFKILKFTLKRTINASTCFDLTKPSACSLCFAKVTILLSVNL